MDTSIVNTIRNTCIVQHKISKNIYLINIWSAHLIAHYVNGFWESATGEMQLNIDLDSLENQTNMDDEKWIIIA